MTCPYLANATDQHSRESRPSMGHVCYAHGAQNPYWNYQAVSLRIQDDLCMAGKAFKRCPVYLAAQQKGHAAPEITAVPAGAGGSWWWPF